MLSQLPASGVLTQEPQSHSPLQANEVFASAPSGRKEWRGLGCDVGAGGGDSPGVSITRGAALGCGDLEETADTGAPVASSRLGTVLLLVWDRRELLRSRVCLPQPAQLGHTRAALPRPTAQPQHGCEGRRGHEARRSPIPTRGSPRDTRQRGCQAVDGPGIAMAADELCAVPALCTLVVVVVPWAGIQGLAVGSRMQAGCRASCHVLPRHVTSHHRHNTLTVFGTGISCAQAVVAH